jgi:hypothetical protein
MSCAVNQRRDREIEVISNLKSESRNCTGWNRDVRQPVDDEGGYKSYAEPRAAESRADFVHKIRIVLEALNKTPSWLATKNARPSASI